MILGPTEAEGGPCAALGTAVLVLEVGGIADVGVADPEKGSLNKNRDR